jgi:hypothetical protein
VELVGKTVKTGKHVLRNDNAKGKTKMESQIIKMSVII